MSRSQDGDGDIDSPNDDGGSGNRPAGGRDDGAVPVTRRGALALLGAAGAGAVGGRATAGSGSGTPDDGAWRAWTDDVDAGGYDLSGLGALETTDSPAISDFAGEGLAVDDGTLSVEDELLASARSAPDEGEDGENGEEPTVHGVRYVDVAEGAEAVQAAVDEVDGDGHNKVVVYGDEGEWNRTVRLPSEFTLEFRDGVTVTSSMSVGTADTFAVGDGMTGAALITNADPANGNENVVVRGGTIDFAGASTDGAIWAPVWLSNCEECLFEDVRVENASGRGGVMFTDCRDSVMRDCVARNAGYDGIALTLDCRRCDVVRCEAYESDGLGIQAATFGQGAGAPRDVNFLFCRTSDNIGFHGYESAGGARNVTIHGCTSRRVSMIGEVRDFRISDCDVDTVALSALDETVRNGRIDSCTMGDRFEDEFSNAALVLWAWTGTVENVSVSNCTAHTDGHQERFAETRLTEPEGTARYVDLTDCAFDGDGVADARFLQHTPDGEASYLESVGTLANLRIQGCKVWNVETVLEGDLEGVRVRNTEFHGVAEGDLVDGDVADLETSQNDWW